MPRKKELDTQVTSEDRDIVLSGETQSGKGNLHTEIVEGESVSSDGEESPRKNWGPPYKAIIVNKEAGFEMGEDRRYRQRVFKFTEKPSEDVLLRLKEAGFVYRGIEKAWTIQANAYSRQISDELAREFAGASQPVRRSR